MYVLYTQYDEHYFSGIVVQRSGVSFVVELRVLIVRIDDVDVDDRVGVLRWIALVLEQNVNSTWSQALV